MALTTVLSVQVQPDRIRAYETLVQKLAEKAAKEDEFRWTAHQVGFGELGRIHFVARHADWSELGRRFPMNALMEKILGAQQAQKMEEEANACSAGQRYTVGVDRPDLSYPPEGREILPLAVVTLVRARSGRQDAVEELIRKVAEAIPKVDDPSRILTYQTVLGDLSTYWTVRPLEDLSDLDAQRQPADLLTEAFGPAEGGLVFRAGLEAIEQVERELLIYRPELSNPA